MIIKKSIKDVLRKIRDIYCYTDFFLNRGLALVNSLYQIVKYTAFASIIVGTLNEVFDFNIPMDKVIYFTPVLAVVLIIAGIVDAKKIRALQKANEINIKYNPYLVNLIKKNKRK